MAEFERLMNFETAQIRKPITTGLKNVKKIKSKPNIKTKPKNWYLVYNLTIILLNNIKLTTE